MIDPDRRIRRLSWAIAAMVVVMSAMFGFGLLARGCNAAFLDNGPEESQPTSNSK